MSISTEQSKSVVRQGMEALFTHDGDLDSLDETYSAEYVGHAPPFPDIEGLQAAKGFALAYRQAFPDLKTTTEDMIAEGEKVMVRWTTSGTHQGQTEAFGPPTGNRMEIMGITVQRFEDGKIAEGWTVADTLGQMQQLGMAPAPEQPLESQEPNGRASGSGSPGPPLHDLIHRSAGKGNSRKVAWHYPMPTSALAGGPGPTGPVL